MYLLTRPSKIFLFEYIARILAGVTGEVGIDAAAERLRNRDMFKTNMYYGIDRDVSALKRGLKSVPDSHAVALEGDLTNLGKIPDRSADVVLSTNTMYQISMPAREDAVRELCRITAPDGICIIEYTKDDDFAASLKITQGFFRDVRVVYFKNPISRWYEKMAYNSLSKERKLFASFPFRVLSWCISRLEYLTQKKASLNGHAIVIARQLFLPGTRNYVTLKDMRQIEERLYSLS